MLVKKNWRPCSSSHALSVHRAVHSVVIADSALAPCLCTNAQCSAIMHIWRNLLRSSAQASFADWQGDSCIPVLLAALTLFLARTSSQIQGGFLILSALTRLLVEGPERCDHAEPPWTQATAAESIPALHQQKNWNAGNCRLLLSSNRQGEHRPLHFLSFSIPFLAISSDSSSASSLAELQPFH